VSIVAAWLAVVVREVRLEGLLRARERVLVDRLACGHPGFGLLLRGLRVDVVDLRVVDWEEHEVIARLVLS